LGDGVTNLPNYIVDEDEWLRLTAERDRYKTALLAIVHQEWQGATACRCIAHAALDGEV
jgi:hypothetical protein